MKTTGFIVVHWLKWVNITYLFSFSYFFDMSVLGSSDGKILRADDNTFRIDQKIREMSRIDVLLYLFFLFISCFLIYFFLVFYFCFSSATSNFHIFSMSSVENTWNWFHLNYLRILLHLKKGSEVVQRLLKQKKQTNKQTNKQKTNIIKRKKERKKEKIENVEKTRNNTKWRKKKWVVSKRKKERV